MVRSDGGSENGIYNIYGYIKNHLGKRIFKKTDILDTNNTKSPRSFFLKKGVYRWKDGRVYSGGWKNNRMEGEGEFKWPDGHYYKGSYKNDRKEGEGTFIW